MPTEAISESEKTATTQSLLELGARVREQRLLRDLTAEQLAAQTKLNRKTILDIEAGRDVRLSSFLRTIRALEVEENVIASLPKQKAADYLKNTRGQPRKRSLGTAKPAQKPVVLPHSIDPPASKSKSLGLSFPYDWSNPNINDISLIINVLERGIYEDICRICVCYGIEKVESHIPDLPDYIGNSAGLKRMFKNIKEGYERAKNRLSTH